MDKFTKTINDEEFVFKIKMPTDKDYSEADIHQSQLFAKLTKMRDEEGNPSFLLRANLEDYLKEKNVYTDEMINEIAEISKKTAEYEDQLFKGGISKAKGREIAIELKRMRFSFMHLMTEKINYDKHTVEYHCDNARFNYLASKCIVFDSNEPVFKSVEDYETDTTIKPEIQDIIVKLSGIVSNFDPDFDKNLPENKFLLKFGFCDEDLNLVDPETGKRVNEYGDFIDEEGREVDEEGNVKNKEQEIGDFFDEEEPEKKVVKKKPRKRKAKAKTTS